MTREEAWNRIDAIIEKHEVDDVYVTINNHKDYDALRFARKLLEQEPILEKVNKMKSEIADSLEFWDYSPNNNPLARDILETVTNFCGDIKEVDA